MSTTTVIHEPIIKSAPAGARVPNDGVERRRRRRAKISAQLHVRSVNSPEPFEEVCMTVDVSRDGLLFTAMQKGYRQGQRLNVAFPYSTDAKGVNQAQPADVVRVSELSGGRYAVAVQFHATSVEPKGTKKSGTSAVNGGAAAVAQQKQQSVVLAVESDARTAEIMRSLLQPDGYTVQIVATAQEALDILRSTIPAVLIAEVEAQDMSGQDLCMIIKRNERLQGIPVILMTRSAKPTDYSASHKMGAVVCMAKPFKPEKLQHVVRLVAPPPAIKNSYVAPRSA